jgi:hypothetical protein
MESTKEYKIEKSPETRQTEKLLRDYPYMLDDIQKLNEEISETLKRKQESQNTLKAATISDMPKGENTSDLTYQAVEKSIDTYDTHVVFLTNKIRGLFEDRRLIWEAMRNITVDEKKAVDLHYFKGYHFERVGSIMHYTRQRAYQITIAGMIKIKTSLIDAGRIDVN